MKDSHIGIEIKLDNEWSLFASAEIDLSTAMQTAFDVVRSSGYDPNEVDYRIVRLTKDERLKHISYVRQNPRHPCPECGFDLTQDCFDLTQWSCESCGKEFTR